MGGCANACVSFFLACCARGSCKRSETETARTYARSLCHWVVAPTLASVFSWRAMLGAAASGRKLRLHGLTLTYCAVGRLPNACVRNRGFRPHGRKGVKSRFQSTFWRKGGFHGEELGHLWAKLICSNQWLTPFLRTRRHESLSVFLFLSCFLDVASAYWIIIPKVQAQHSYL